jgi:hypothetical protein
MRFGFSRRTPLHSRPPDPAVQSLMEEAARLPECAAKIVLLERAATRAEALGDLDTAWQMRLSILGSDTTHADPRFETLFLSLAWCFGLSDAEPDRFPIDDVLWQYKWVCTQAPRYASVPLEVLERLLQDLHERYVRAGWGRRGALQMRIEMLEATGRSEEAKALVPEWLAIPRDRGADCHACELDAAARLLGGLGLDEESLRVALPIVRGERRCSVVPHSTFGQLLAPLVRLGRLAQARRLYDQGRRLVAAMSSGGGGGRLSGPYLLHAAFVGEIDAAHSILRTRLPEAARLRSDEDRFVWHTHASLALRRLHDLGEIELELPHMHEFGASDRTDAVVLAARLESIARSHREALDRRDGRESRLRWAQTLAATYAKPAS